MRMIYTERMLLCRNVVAQYQIQLIRIAASSCNRSDRIVRLAVCLGVDECRLVRVASPCEENLVCQIDQTILVCCADTDDRHRPFYNPCLYILISFECDLALHRCLCHGELIMTALEMIVA